MKDHTGWYAIVQFCPDPARLEAANIGVVLFCSAVEFLDVRMSPDNSRITRFFGPLKPEWQCVDSFKQGLVERVRRESERIVNAEQLQDFIDRRTSFIRLTYLRPIRVSDPAKTLGDLFEKLVAVAESEKTCGMLD